jgi:CrcB protein
MRPPDPRPALTAAVAVALGGAAGAGCRWALGVALPHPGGWPLPTLAANGVGCLLLGVVVARLPLLAGRALTVGRHGLATGFCGGLTTFSTFSVELARFQRDGRTGLAVAYLTASLVTGYAAFVAGRRGTRRPAPSPSPEPSTAPRPSPEPAP